MLLWVLCLMSVTSWSDASIETFAVDEFQQQNSPTYPALPTYTATYRNSPGGYYPPTAPPTSTSCRYWCRTRDWKYFCCDTGRQPTNRPPTGREKPGFCPPVRRFCPTQVGYYDPKLCNYDNECPGTDKCCFDKCLAHRTCKPADPRYGGYTDYSTGSNSW